MREVGVGVARSKRGQCFTFGGVALSVRLLEVGGAMVVDDRRQRPAGSDG